MMGSFDFQDLMLKYLHPSTLNYTTGIAIMQVKIRITVLGLGLRRNLLVTKTILSFNKTFVIAEYSLRFISRPVYFHSFIFALY